MTSVWIGSERIDVDRAPVLGQGGEAVVHDLGDRALKLFKGPRHPDVTGDAAREAAAATRLAELDARLRDCPRPLPAAVVTPLALARAGKASGAPAVGYVMAKVAGRPLHELGEPRVRKPGATDLPALVHALRSLHTAVGALHAAGVVLGDFNDGNVLVDGPRVHLLDADSFQYGRWPCTLYTERFVDPRLCARPAAAPVLAHPHDRDSDWYAFAVMVFRTLLWVGPFGGVHAPAEPARRVAPAARPLEGPPVFAADVTYPRAAVPLAALPDDLADHFADVFARGRRGPFPAALLDRLRLTRCDACAIDHGRARCPSCAKTVAVPAALPLGALSVRALAAAPPPHAWPVGRTPHAGAPPVWMSGGTLWRHGLLGPEPIGQILDGLTSAWVGPRLGAGLWRAGGHAVGFTFSPDRRGVDDRVRLPALRGQLLDRGCVLADDRAWLWWREAFAGREQVTVAVVGGGRLHALAAAPADDRDWMAGLGGACAAGPHLLVPTDAGIVRVELVAGQLVVGRRFPETAPFVCAADDLAVVPDGLAVRKATRVALPAAAGAPTPVHHLVLSFR
ncbi:MAG TPA: hypothetical protein VHE35_09130 [Kofleriaceae bacterium]|nr:hypothetical protein [Kofleriaceae bacterium]